MANCPKCGAPISANDPKKPAYCSCCGEYTVIGTKNAVISDAQSESDDLFLSGCSYLALGDTENAADRFLLATNVSPSVARYWLYLLFALTEKFDKLWLIADKESAVSVKGKRVICRNVYRNFLRTAKSEDHVLAKKELGVNTEPSKAEIWQIILYRILVPDDTKPPKDTAYAASYAYNELKKLIPEKAKALRQSLCDRLNPMTEDILEINTLSFYEKTRDGVLELNTKASIIEFSSDDVPGKERFRAFRLTNGIESIGTHFPFTELIVSDDVSVVPDRLLFCCENVEKITLSPAVTVIGNEAFSNCVSLSSINLGNNITAIGDMAFFNTAIRVLEMPASVKHVGASILGVLKKRTEETDVSQYLMVVSEQTERARDWNAVGTHFCGYAVKKRVGAEMYYPIKTEALTTREKMIFEALVYSKIDPSEFEKGGSIKSKLSALFKK